MEYAKTLVPMSLMRSSLAQRMLNPPQPRPYKVCTHNRRQRKGFTATSLDDLLDQVRYLHLKVSTSFMMSYHVLMLVLEDDGTLVDSEDFFQSLPTNTAFMVLEEGEIWTASKRVLPSFRQPRKSGIAKLSFDLYKLNPKDFLGCLTIKVTLYEIYTLSYDIKCTRSKYFLKGFLQCFMYMAKLTGQALLHSASYVLRCIGDEERSR